MIGRITGRLLEKTPPQVLVDVHGVGYELDVPMSTFYNLPAVGETVALLTHFVVREDAQLLYGFLSAPERATFRELVHGGDPHDHAHSRDDEDSVSYYRTMEIAVRRLLIAKGVFSEFLLSLRGNPAVNFDALDVIDNIGIQGLSASLAKVIEDANQKIDFGFLSVHEGIYKLRQLVLDKSRATRLATSPALAQLAAEAQSDGALRVDIQNLLARLDAATKQ